MIEVDMRSESAEMHCIILYLCFSVKDFISISRLTGHNSFVPTVFLTPSKSNIPLLPKIYKQTPN